VLEDEISVHRPKRLYDPWPLKEIFAPALAPKLRYATTPNPFSMTFWRALFIITLGCGSLGLGLSLGNDYLQRNDQETARLRAEMAEAHLAWQLEQCSQEFSMARERLQYLTMRPFQFIGHYNWMLQEDFTDVEQRLGNLSGVNYDPVKANEMLVLALGEGRGQQSEWRRELERLLFAHKDAIAFDSEDVLFILHSVDRESSPLENLEQLPEFRASNYADFRYARAQLLSALALNQMRYFEPLNYIGCYRRINDSDYYFPVVHNRPENLSDGDSLHLSMQLAYFSDDYGPDRAWVVINGDTLATNPNGTVEYQGVYLTGMEKGLTIESFVRNPLTGEVTVSGMRYDLGKD
jgi:hypothetical protein